MKKHLCFVFIQEYKCLKNRSICLDDRYVFDFDKDNNVLIVRKNESHIDHLWGDGIYSLTAIVGENGAGKTTTIRYIMEMAVSGQNKEMDGGVYVVEEHGKLYVYSTRKIQLKNNNEGLEVELSNDKFSINTFFYSAHFSLPSAMDIITDNEFSGMYNGSDSWRLLNDYQNYSNIDTFGMQQTIQKHVIGYNSQNFYRIALLLTEQYEKMKEYDLQPPQYIFIIPNTSGQYSFLQKKREVDVEIPNIDLSLNNNLTRKKRTLYMFVYHMILNMATDGAKVREDIIDTLNEWVKKFNWNDLDDENFYESFEQLLDKYFSKVIIEYISSLLQELESNLNEMNNMFYVDLSDKEKRSEFKSLLEDSRKHLIFLTARYFDMFYAHSLGSVGSTLLSSGEQEVLNLFSRIYVEANPKKMYSKDNIAIPWLLILDEAEIGYHPMWQRKYVNNIVKFLNILTKEKDFFQVILTSHSPIILSDIPRSCTNYLAINGDSISMEETFGANIFDLYRTSFFMSDGLIGEFALDKIQKVLKAISPKEHETSDDDMTLEEAEKIIPIIGDDRIRDYLKEKLYKDNPQYAIECYKRKIEELQDKIKNEQDRIS